MKQQLNRIIVPSESSSAEYVVVEYDDKSWSCSCPKWKIHRGERVNCKHIQKIIDKRSQEITLSIDEVKSEIKTGLFFTDNQLDILNCLVENEIESNVDYLNDVKEEEKEYWKQLILDLKDIKLILERV